MYDDCGVTSDCTLVRNACCPSCGMPVASDFTSVAVDHRDLYLMDVGCTGEPPPCPDCPSAPNPHLAATCDMTGLRAACTVVDFETEPFAACTTDDDCVLAKPDCCACGEVAIHETIAVRGDANLDAVLCDSLEAACPPCVPFFDPGAMAQCEAGRCVVRVATE